MKAPRLLIPGPVDVDDDVLEVLGASVVPHYGAAWGAMYVEMLEALRRVFRTRGTAFALPGSGSTALDMMMNNLLRRGDRVIVAENGYFGHRLGEIAESYGAQVIRIEGQWGEPIDPDAVRAAFRGAGPVTAVAMVHAETSTGIVNPLREVAAIADEHGAAMLADAVTSLGGVELDMDGWGIDFVASGSQKSLAAPAGLGLIGVSERGWQRLAALPPAERGWYLDLRRWRRDAEETPPWHPHPVTVPPGNVRALHRQLQKIHAMGLDAWLARHVHAAARFRAGLAERGLKPLVDGPAAAPMLTITGLPDGADQREVIDQLRERFGLYCSGGFGYFQGRALRIGHMGKAASDEYVDAALAALGALFPA